MAQDPESDEDADVVYMMANEGIGPQSASSDRRSTVWNINFAETAHMSFDRSAFATYTPNTPFPVGMGDISTSLAVARGHLHLSIGKSTKCKLYDVLHVPLFCVFSDFCVYTRQARPESPVLRRLRQDTLWERTRCKRNTSRRLYTLDLSAPSKHEETTLGTASLQLWHERMCHVHQADILNMARNKVVKSMEIHNEQQDIQACEAYIAVKRHRSSIARVSTSLPAGLLDLMHTDVDGPCSVPSKGGALYFVAFIDNRSRQLILLPIKSNPDCFSCFLVPL